RNLSRSMELLEQSAKSGYLKAIHNLGLNLIDGFPADNIPSDPDRAIKLFEESAAKGHLPSMKELGKCYEEGIGVKTNLETAFSWFSKGSAAGSADCDY